MTEFLTQDSDTTLDKQSEEMIQKHQILFENAQDIILYVRMDGSIADANRSAVNKYGFSKKELLTKKIQDIRAPSTLEVFTQQMLQADQEGVLFECLHQKKDGTIFPVEVSARSTETSEGRLRVHIIRDISERKMYEEKIIQLANYDSLTGIPNRGNLLTQLDFELEFAQRNELKLALMLLDIDKFKSINDRFGHVVGDTLLKYVTETIKSVLRKAEIIGRLGGDEFVILQTNLKDRKSATSLAKKILAAIQKPLIIEGREVSASVSIGISIFPSDTKDGKEMLYLADQAMYDAKRKGGGIFTFVRV